MRLDQYMGTDPKLRQKPLKSPILTIFAIIFETFRKNPKKWCRLGSNPDAKQKAGKLPWRWNGTLSQNGYGTLRVIELKECAVPTMASLEICEPTQKASSTQMASQAVPHPSTDRALRRLTSEFGRDLVYSSRYGRLQPLTCWVVGFRQSLLANAENRPRFPHFDSRSSAGIFLVTSEQKDTQPRRPKRRYLSLKFAISEYGKVVYLWAEILKKWIQL